MAKVLSISLVAMLCVGASTALADDINPPPWRGQWSTTYQWWQFSTPDNGGTNGLTPDGPGRLIEGQPGQPYVEAGYLESTRLWVYPVEDWMPADSTGRQGVWPLSGRIEVVVDNHDPVNPEKLLWVQLTWMPTPGTTGVPEIIPADLPHEFTSTPVRMEGEIPTADGWFTTTYTWEIRPNPIDEFFTISGDIYVDQLVIDTWCIPEPATLSLLALGGLALIRRKR